MNKNPPVPASDSLRSAYHNYEIRVLSRGLIVGNGIGAMGMPGGFVLDYFLYPSKFTSFLEVRLGVAAFLLAIIGILLLARNRGSLPWVKILGILSGLSMNFAFCWMIYNTEGARSPYYAGVILIITFWSVLMPWTVLETVVMCVISYLGYAVACFANPGFSGATSLPLFAYYSFFILITTATGGCITYFLSRARFEDFQLRHQLDLQNRDLQDLDRVKTQFFSNVSHELRTPLTLILGPVETLLARAETLEARVHEGLLLVHRNSLRLLKLINDLLELNKLDQGAEVLRKKAFAPGVFVRGIVDSVRHLGLSKQLKIKIQESDADAHMFADPSRMEKVLINLLTNAFKYTQPGGTITVRWASDEQESRIEVEDTGVGIPAEDLSKIFDRFHQVRSNLTNRNQGVGIGLALAKELVEEHEGKIEVESEVGKGTIFRIRLPAATGVQEAPPSPAEEASSAEEPFERAFRSADRSWRSYNDGSSLETFPVVGNGAQSVLVADDEHEMRGYIVSLLSEQYRVVQTADGSLVAGLVAEHKPDLVLLDWMMPGKDGLSLCQDLRSDDANEDLKIVLLTARIDEKSKLDALQAGADDFLTKPFSSIEVMTRVANLLRAAGLQKDVRNRNAELTSTLEKLQRTESMLIQSEKMNAIGSLSAGLLHEINNPLNYTLTAINFAQRHKDSLNEDMKEVITDIEEGMIRVRDVVTHLKNFAYPEKAGTVSTFSLDEVFQSARKIVSKETEDIRIEADLPAVLVVSGQKTQMIHLFINLLSNASRALGENPPQGPKIITVRGTTSEETAVVEFADNGPGIPATILNRVFEPFFTTREVGSGMGMGLSICHTIMETHHGSIRVNNRAGSGAVFTITLPLAEEALKLC